LKGDGRYKALIFTRSDQNLYDFTRSKGHLVSSSAAMLIFYKETATPTSSKKLIMTLFGFLLSGIKRQRTRWSITACRTRGIGSMWPVDMEKKRTVVTSFTRALHCLEMRKYAMPQKNILARLSK